MGLRMIDSVSDPNVADQEPFLTAWMRAVLIIVVPIALLCVILVYGWGASPRPCKVAFPMWIGCTLGKFETLTSGVIAAFAAWFAGWAALRSARLQINAQRKAESRQAAIRVDNFARALHAELADLVARCCFDTEVRWHTYLPANAQGSLVEHELRSFAPAQPTIFANSSGDLASLGEDAPLRLVQFYNSLTALRRDIGDISDGLTGNPANPKLVRRVAQRFLFTLRPGLDALRALSPLVPNSEDVERTAIGAYDANSQGGPPPDGTLRDRIERLLKSTNTGRQ